VKHYLCVLLLIVAALAAGCSAGSGPAGPGGGANKPAQPADGLSANVLHGASGVPAGVRLSWTSLTGDVVGYHVYKADAPIPDSALGNNGYWLDVGGNTLVPQAQNPGDLITIEDRFAAQIGDTWYYRLTGVDASGDESNLSPEEAVTIGPFEITALRTPLVAVGGTLIIAGRFFGEQQEAGDTVQVVGVVWKPGTGFHYAVLDAPVVSWQPTEIQATLPLGATSGPAQVTIGGVTLPTPEVLTNSDPYITHLSPLIADATIPVTLDGNNFGAGPDPLHRVIFASQEILDLAKYVSYTNTQIVFYPLFLGQTLERDVNVRVDTTTSNTGHCTTSNALPVAYLVGEPAEGPEPLTVTFKPARLLPDTTYEYSYDPDGQPLVSYAYDFIGSGQPSLTVYTPQDVTHTYNTMGTYQARVTVRDVNGGTATALFTVIVDAPTAVVLADNGSPGPTDLKGQANLTILYTLTGGRATYRIDWVLVDASVPSSGEFPLATDLIPAQGPGQHVFQVDPNMRVPVPGSNTIPLGTWQIRGETHDNYDANDPDGMFTWPIDAQGNLGVYTL